jgi:lipopolysaccharide export LptBFGC system permease protein LptF
MFVKNEKELAQAIKNGDDYIEVEGDFGKRILKIKATGKVAWAIAIGVIGVATVAILKLPARTGGAGLLAKGFIATGAGATAVGVLGIPTVITAISIAVAAGDVGVLNKLRNYKLEKISDTHIKLLKK